MSEQSTPELGGYCPVAYFVAGEALPGKAEFSSTYQGKTYQFVSADALREFERDPEQYLPAYGGKCAFGMSIEKEFEPCPTNFKIIDGKLHLFLKTDDTDALELWNTEEEAKCRASADAYWTRQQSA